MSRTATALLLTLLAVPGAAQQPAAPGATVYERACASCHTGAANAPSREVLRAMTPEVILNALTNGKMQVQGRALSDADRRAVAEFLSERAFGTAAAASATATCTASQMRDPARGSAWNGWGNGIANTRRATAPGLTVADVPKLKLKWAFGYEGVNAARAQPALAGGRLFAASENGQVHALDPKTGCTHWTFKAIAGIRTGLTVQPYKTPRASGYAVYFADAAANAYAVDAQSGREIWVRKVDEHPAAAVTGAPAVHDGRVYVPVQGLNEERQGGRAGYGCCTFRGSVVSLDANTGAIVWKTYTVDEPKPRAKGADGGQLFGPAGGGIWASPTVDPKRGLVYVATGNTYADPPQAMANAVIALNLKTGAVAWVKQTTANDTWAGGCGRGANPNCPDTLGPDVDFSASPALATIAGRELLIIPQKSGIAYALDPDKQGAIVWETRFGRGGAFGGQWGAAVDDQQVYVGVGDLASPTPGGMRALNAATGAMVWSVDAPPRLCGTERGCRAGQGGAVTVIPGAVFSGSLDGGMRAYSIKDGSIIWQVDTNTEYKTVNGVKAVGGGLEGAGAIVVDGMVYFNSGYGGVLNRPGNVLLAFGVE
jgi:polyvinyl alcohol dehydrogenase (cytochrome)